MELKLLTTLLEALISKLTDPAVLVLLFVVILQFRMINKLVDSLGKINASLASLTSFIEILIHGRNV